MRGAVLVLGIALTAAMIVDAAVSDTVATSQPAATSNLWTIVKLRGQIAVQSAEIARLNAELDRCRAKLDAAEKWNVNFLLWLNPGGTWGRKPPRQALDYCLSHSGAGVPSPGECWFLDYDRDRDVDADDAKLWEAAK